MSATVVKCSMPGCQAPASHKVAAVWSDGRFSELKTYGHACAKHLGAIFRAAEERRAAYKPDPNEAVEEIGIYLYKNGWVECQLQRLGNSEEHYRSWGSGAEGV
jgi:hypothetical protein